MNTREGVISVITRCNLGRSTSLPGAKLTQRRVQGPRLCKFFIYFFLLQSRFK